MLTTAQADQIVQSYCPQYIEKIEEGLGYDQSTKTYRYLLDDSSVLHVREDNEFYVKGF